MSCVRKVVSELDINAPAENYYKIFKHKTYDFPKICPKWIQDVKIDEGDWNNHGHGSILTWNLIVDGKAEVYKERMEYDDKNLAVTLVGLEGSAVFERYKKFKGTYKVVPKGPKHCTAVLTLEYEKQDDTCPCPYKYLDLMCGVTKDIESHIN